MVTRSDVQLEQTGTPVSAEPTDPFPWAAAACAALPASEVDHPYGDQTDVYKVGGKSFALLSAEREPPWLSLKLPPDLNVALREEFPDTVLPGYYLNKTHWSSIVLSGDPSREQVSELLRTSYDLVVASLPRRLRPVVDD